MSNLDIDKIIVSKKVSFGKNGFKYLNSYKKDKKVKTLYVILSKISGYTGNYDNFDRRWWIVEKWKIWNKVSNDINKEFDNDLVYDEKYLRTKIKSYKGKKLFFTSIFRKM